jgi:hypothetical protein
MPLLQHALDCLTEPDKTQAKDAFLGHYRFFDA